MTEKRNFASEPRYKYDYEKTALENAVDAYNNLAAEHAALVEAATQTVSAWYYNRYVYETEDAIEALRKALGDKDPIP